MANFYLLVYDSNDKFYKFQYYYWMEVVSLYKNLVRIKHPTLCSPIIYVLLFTIYNNLRATFMILQELMHDFS